MSRREALEAARFVAGSRRLARADRGHLEAPRGDAAPRRRSCWNAWWSGWASSGWSSPPSACAKACCSMRWPPEIRRRGPAGRGLRGAGGPPEPLRRPGRGAGAGSRRPSQARTGLRRPRRDAARRPRAGWPTSARRLHPDHRADLVFDQVLRAPIAGMNHAERAFLACACFRPPHRRPDGPRAALVVRLLTPERLQRARALGAAMRLGCDLSGRNARAARPTPARLQDLTPSSCGAEARWAAMLLGEQTGKARWPWPTRSSAN